jgi:hypothetical protein
MFWAEELGGVHKLAIMAVRVVDDVVDFGERHDEANGGLDCAGSCPWMTYVLDKGEGETDQGNKRARTGKFQAVEC